MSLVKLGLVLLSVYLPSIGNTDGLLVHQNFYVSARTLNSDPPACTASTSSTEPPHSPPKFLSNVRNTTTVPSPKATAVTEGKETLLTGSVIQFYSGFV